MSRRLLAFTVVLFALGAPSANAATICVPSGTDCDDNRLLLEEAIDLAATTPAIRDTIRMSAGTSSRTRWWEPRTR